MVVTTLFTAAVVYECGFFSEIIGNDLYCFYCYFFLLLFKIEFY